MNKNLLVSFFLLVSALGYSQKWQVLPNTSASATIYSLCTFNDTLIAGGTSVAKWTGSTWDTLGGSFGGGYIDALEVFNNQLYAAGGFTLIQGTDTMQNVAVWNGSKWAPVGKGLNDGYVTNLVAAKGYLFAGFTNASYTGTVSRWNGASWDSVTTFSESIEQMQLLNDSIYVTALFVEKLYAFNQPAVVNNVPIPGYATYYNIFTYQNKIYGADGTWDGSTWQNLAGGNPYLTYVSSQAGINGNSATNLYGLEADSVQLFVLNDTMQLLAVDRTAIRTITNATGIVLLNDTLYVSGATYLTGGTTATVPVVMLDLSSTLTSLTQVTTSAAATAATLYPNPNKGAFTLQGWPAGAATIYNSQGAPIQTVNCISNNATINLGNAPAGIYYVVMQTATGTATQKVIVE